MNIQQKLKDNITALRLVLENDGKKLTSQQVEQLKRYTGFGGIKAVLWGDGPLETWKDASATDRSLYIQFQELYELLHMELTGREYKAAIESIKNGILSQYFTPAIVPRVFYEVLQKYHDPQNMLEPSAGVGVFITEAKGILDLNYIVSYEKDILTGKLLEAIVPYTWNDGVSSPTRTEGGRAFENSDPGEEDFDLICSNIPFGAIPVYDEKLPREVTTKIHNYFFAKGLTKLREGGILAYVVTSAFLDTVTNSAARKYLFERADFISLTVMPDNLMKETGNTEAPSHFLVVRKNSSKTEMSAEEQSLCVSENTQVWNGKANVTISRNKYIAEHDTDIVLGSMKVGTNQYGKPNIEVLWAGDINEIAESFRNVLEKDFAKRYLYTADEKVPDTQSINHKSDNMSDEMPPWEDTDKLLIEGQGCWDDEEDEDSPGIGVDHKDEASSCVGCGVGMFGDEPFCYQCKEEGRTLESVSEEEDNVDRVMTNMSMYEPPIVHSTIPEVQQTEPVKKELSKRDREVLSQYLKIKEVFIELENQKNV